MPNAHNQITVLQQNATANGNGAVGTVAGYDGSASLQITNGAGTCTVNVEGSFDSAFTTTQDIALLAVVKDYDTAAGTNVSRTLLSGAIAVAANTSYLYELPDAGKTPYLRARISAASALGAGTNDTGCTVTLLDEEI